MFTIKATPYVEDNNFFLNIKYVKVDLNRMDIIILYSNTFLLFIYPIFLWIFQYINMSKYFAYFNFIGSCVPKVLPQFPLKLLSVTDFMFKRPWSKMRKCWEDGGKRRPIKIDPDLQIKPYFVNNITTLLTRDNRQQSPPSVLFSAGCRS